MKSSSPPSIQDVSVSDCNWIDEDSSSLSLLFKSAGIAFLFEAMLLILVGSRDFWFSHPPKLMIEDHFLDAQIYSVPATAHLVEEKKKPVAVPKPEATLSKTPGQGRASPKTDSVDTENQTQSGVQLPPSHGPVALFAPLPVIPVYLQNQDLKAHVVIDFYVNAQGQATPRLVGSSGNEELDAIAIQTVKKWQFRPAEEEHRPIDAKVRLRIIFEVK